MEYNYKKTDLSWDYLMNFPLPYSFFFNTDISFVLMMLILSLQIVSGKLRRATFVGPHSTGPAVVFAGLMKGSMRFTSVVGKVRMKYGNPLFENLEASTVQNQEVYIL